MTLSIKIIHRLFFVLNSDLNPEKTIFSSHVFVCAAKKQISNQFFFMKKNNDLKKKQNNFYIDNRTGAYLYNQSTKCSFLSSDTDAHNSKVTIDILP